MFAKVITIPYNFNETFNPDSGYTNYSYTETFAATILESWDEYCFDTLFNLYKESGITKALVISKGEFKQFLLEYLPKYVKKHKSDRGGE